MKIDLKLICLLTVVSSALLLAGCAAGEPVRINSATESSFERTYQSMANSLSQQDQIMLTAAMVQIGAQGTGSVMEFQQQNPDGMNLVDVRDQIDGMTYEEILALAGQSGIQVFPITESVDKY